mmetsp:Transcript_64247/g.76065  ORF Transcript_64247/g.76065 Transcript_64247/m.76065 type:complete len:100 (+) Transcript_64247:3-302(+)
MEHATHRLLHHKSSVFDFFEKSHVELRKLLDVSLIGIQIQNPLRAMTFGDKEELSSEVFDCLADTYSSVCKDYGVVFIDKQNHNPVLTNAGLRTLTYIK